MDGDDKIKVRIDGERERIEVELGMRPIILDQGLKKSISSKIAQRPNDSYREGVKGDFPAMLIYTR